MYKKKQVILKTLTDKHWEGRKYTRREFHYKVHCKWPGASANMNFSLYASASSNWMSSSVQLLVGRFCKKIMISWRKREREMNTYKEQRGKARVWKKREEKQRNRRDVLARGERERKHMWTLGMRIIVNRVGAHRKRLPNLKILLCLDCSGKFWYQSCTHIDMECGKPVRFRLQWVASNMQNQQHQSLKHRYYW